jgi:hypothetical protein
MTVLAVRRTISPGDRLRALAVDVRRIHDPYRSNPERILEQKDAIAHELRRIARDLEAAHG